MATTHTIHFITIRFEVQTKFLTLWTWDFDEWIRMKYSSFHEVSPPIHRGEGLDPQGGEGSRSSLSACSKTSCEEILKDIQEINGQLIDLIVDNWFFQDLAYPQFDIGFQAFPL